MAVRRRDGFGLNSSIIKPKVSITAPKSDDEDEAGASSDVNADQESTVVKQVELSLEGSKSNSHDQLKNKPDLIKLLHEIDDYQIFLPDSIVKYHLERAGCNVDPTDHKVVRIVGLAAQRFATLLTQSALTYNIEKESELGVRIPSKDRTLTMNDISKAAADEGIKIPVSKRPRLEY